MACSEQSEKTIIKELWVIPFIKNKDRKNENYRNASILNNQKQQRRLIETNAEKMILSIYNKLV